MIVIGLDVSLSSTGWSVLKDDKLINFGLIETKKGDKRLNIIYNNIRELLITYSPDEVHMEDGFIGPNRKTSMEITKARSIVELLCEQLDLNLLLVPPSSVKKQITGNGKSKKDSVAIALYERFKDDEVFQKIGPYSDKKTKKVKKTSDIYDSIGIGLSYPEE